MSITRYVLVDRDNNEQDYEFENYQEAQLSALGKGFAVIERTYEFADSELVWTPDGGRVWPVKKGANDA